MKETKRIKSLLVCFFSLLVLMLCNYSLAQSPAYDYTWQGKEEISYHSDTLIYSIETTYIQKCKCYITKVWVQQPSRQIRKATAEWKKSLMLPADMAALIDGCALAFNGSGYVSKTYPWIPETYPGESRDYWCTPLGSLTITDGEVFRNLESVPYYGITLEQNGLKLYNGETTEAVLQNDPIQTWSFYEQCPMILDHEDILDREWRFASQHAARTIIACMDENNYVFITATSSVGLTLTDAVEFLQVNFDPSWAYDLDGGPSSALIYRKQGKKKLHILYGGNAKDADLIGFTE